MFNLYTSLFLHFLMLILNFSAIDNILSDDNFDNNDTDGDDRPNGKSFLSLTSLYLF